jgi:hypothetical protein
VKKTAPVLALFLGLAVVALAQRTGGGRFGRRGGFGGGNGSTARTAREEPSGSTGTPEWTNPRGFEREVFTFARIRYGQGGLGVGGYYGRRGGGWHTDAPDSDLNLSYRLQQMTSLRVDPNGRYLDLTDPALADFPWIYIVEPGALGFTEPEVAALRKYLLNGGFLWFDDFWGEAAWQNVEREMKRVLPDRAFVETSLDHPLYHCVFNITAKGQIPGIGRWDGPGSSTSERGEESAVVHHRAIWDDKGRLLVLATHNTDNGDGWEREGENVDYFKTFSEKIAYPLGINVIFYVMTH